MALSFFVRLGTVEALGILKRRHTAGAVDLPLLLCVSERFRIVVALGVLKQRSLVVALGILVLLSRGSRLRASSRGFRTSRAGSARRSPRSARSSTPWTLLGTAPRVRRRSAQVRLIYFEQGLNTCPFNDLIRLRAPV